jgi:hypothetical protein
MTKELKNDLIVIIILFIGALYLFLNPGKINETELKKIAGILEKKPELCEDCGNMGDNNIRFKLKTHPFEFDIEGYSYDNINNKEKFLSLKKGEPLIILVRKERTTREKINRDIDCFDIRSPNGLIYLKVSEVNKYYNNSWKLILSIGFLFIIIVLLKKIKIKKLKTKHHS